MNTEDKVAITSRSFSANTQLIDELKTRYKNISLNTSGRTLAGDDLLNFLENQNKVIVGLEKFDEALIKQLPNLKVISKFGVGLNNIDLNIMKERSIALGFKEGTNKQSVAELALMHILVALRKVPSSKEDISNTIWSQKKGNELYGKTIGIIGFGNIGQKLAALLEPFQCSIIFYDNFVFCKEDLQSQFSDRTDSFINNLEQKSLDEVLTVADIISIHLPLLNETKNLIDLNALDRMKDNINIINTSRGGIVNENALFDFLTKNKNAFAAFDVFLEEPAFNNPLLALNNFYATSHLGSMTEEGVLAMGLAAIDGLDENSIPL